MSGINNDPAYASAAWQFIVGLLLLRRKVGSGKRGMRRLRGKFEARTGRQQARKTTRRAS